MEAGPYVDLYDPSIDWLFLNLRDCTGFQEAEVMMEQYRNGWNNTVILVNLLKHLNKEFVSLHAKVNGQ